MARIRDRLGDVYGGVFGRMEKDSTYPAVLSANDAARAAEADLMIAAGGGSVSSGPAGDDLPRRAGIAFELMTQYPEGKPP